jgi:hypothetical protein
LALSTFFSRESSSTPATWRSTLCAGPCHVKGEHLQLDPVRLRQLQVGRRAIGQGHVRGLFSRDVGRTHLIVTLSRANSQVYDYPSLPVVLQVFLIPAASSNFQCFPLPSVRPLVTCPVRTSQPPPLSATSGQRELAVPQVELIVSDSELAFPHFYFMIYITYIYH